MAEDIEENVCEKCEEWLAMAKSRNSNTTIKNTVCSTSHTVILTGYQFYLSHVCVPNTGCGYCKGWYEQHHTLYKLCSTCFRYGKCILCEIEPFDENDTSLAKLNEHIIEDFRTIASSPQITWDIIQARPELHRDWKWICLNPNITPEIVQANPDRPWNLHWLYNLNPIWKETRKRIQGRTVIIKEELMAAVWSPGRVMTWLEAGWDCSE